MCGIVGGVAQRDVTPILVEGLRRLEYRGYDSAGIAVIDNKRSLKRLRVLGKVDKLQAALKDTVVQGALGIAHTRWATHGEPSTRNAHPHASNDCVALVHNGIIENHNKLRLRQSEKGYQFTSDTDTEVAVHQIYDHIKTGKDLLTAVLDTAQELEGAFALGVISASEPDRLIAARRGSPLVIGIGIGETFIASDVFALLPVTQRFIFLEEGDVADIRRDGVAIYDAGRRRVERRISISQLSADSADKAGYRHYMLKEIFTQARAVADTLEGRTQEGRVVEDAFGFGAHAVFDQVRAVQIVACGTSFHAGLVTRYWMEGVAGIPCSVEIASEFRYRKSVVQPGTLFVAISQSGETADTLAALRLAKSSGYLDTLAICNVSESSLTREAGLVFLTRAGPEIGVASTKAFTTQLTAMLLLVVALGRRRGLDAAAEKALVSTIESLPGKLNQALLLNDRVKQLSEQFADKHHALYLGRGAMYPVAMEGALKLKEISYIHAEAYPAGELKHGPLALVDEDMPVIAVAPNNELLEKLKSNLEEVRARKGKLYVFVDPSIGMQSANNVAAIETLSVDDLIAPIVYTVPLQLLAYHVAVLKGADIDQPRNLAKSVTVE
ncbi:MAG: Glutamine--fructose-6-phosphate aminotransferase [isomerizing] [Chromatiales bacterium USCg_Taylor]|nr:MAG: Glutamine--fructose-6-phosphate aminotransferase [isomerizing] [Chromatiales bacterium USCg_Taylor]